VLNKQKEHLEVSILQIAIQIYMVKILWNMQDKIHKEQIQELEFPELKIIKEMFSDQVETMLEMHLLEECWDHQVVELHLLEEVSTIKDTLHNVHQTILLKAEEVEVVVVSVVAI
jgi:hypothetical protein